MAEKSTDRTRKAAKKPVKQPIPIDSGPQASQTAASARPESNPSTQPNPGIEEEIRRRAYELYEERGRQEGFQEEDWSRAESEILAKYQRESA